MTIRGNVIAAALVWAAAIAGVVLVLPIGQGTAKEPMSEQIKASARARLDASLDAGLEARQVAVDEGYTPGEELGQAVWDKKTKAERRALSYGMWMHGCADVPA